MKLAMRVTLGCLLLIFALLFGGCGLIPNPFSQEPASETTTNKSDLDQQEKTKKGQIDQLKADLLKQQRDATAERKECNDMKQKTLDDQKNPDDFKDAPKTFVQCNDAAAAEYEIAETKKDLQKVEGELTDIQKLKNELPPDDTNSNNSGWLMSLLIGVAGVLGLAILLGGLYILLSKKIDKAIAEERSLNQQNSDRIKAKHDKLFAEHGKVMNDLEKLVKLQQGKIEVLEFKAKEKGTGFGGQMPPQPPAEQPQYIKPEPQFPVSVENYLNKVRQQGQRASADTIGGLLIQDPSKNEEFMIVKDSSLANELYYAVPSFARFPTKSEYFTYYQNYYNCENPSGGAVWIISPTVVRRTDDGWQLQQKGELEVR